MAERDFGHNPIQLRTTSWWIVYNIVCKFSSQRSKTDQSLAQTVHTPIKNRKTIALLRARNVAESIFAPRGTA